MRERLHWGGSATTAVIVSLLTPGLERLLTPKMVELNAWLYDLCLLTGWKSVGKEYKDCEITSSAIQNSLNTESVLAV